MKESISQEFIVLKIAKITWWFALRGNEQDKLRHKLYTRPHRDELQGSKGDKNGGLLFRNALTLIDPIKC